MKLSKPGRGWPLIALNVGFVVLFWTGWFPIYLLIPIIAVSGALYWLEFR